MSDSSSEQVLAHPLAETNAQRHPESADGALWLAALEHLPQGLCLFDAQDQLILANHRYTQIYGLPAALVRPGTSFAQILAATAGHEVPCGREQPLPFASGTRYRQWQMADGRLVRVCVTHLPNGCSIALHEDITEQHRSQAQASYLARHDVLTGLPNRAVLCESLQALFRQATAGPAAVGQEAALLCLDLDQFKAVNDRFGHPAGDDLLCQVASRLRACVRDADLVVRLGGDEFAVLQFATRQPSGAKVLARRLIDSLGEVFDLSGQRAYIGASVGIAVAPFDGDDPDALLKNADLALYQAKADGRATLRFFEPGMDTRASSRRELETDLRQALERGEFSLAYQAQVDMASGQVAGVEALLRWDHPQRGRVGPNEFIALAEDSGLIVPIGRWVLLQACTDALAWPTHVRVAVNVSAVQFRQGTLLRDVSHALEVTGLPADRLEIEVTESVMLQDPAQARGLLQELRKRGVRVAMDDFGTGYSSLASLRSFAFDRIKIDRSFVQDLETSPDALAIVRAVASLGRSLGIATTVEGVETAAQLSAVQAEGCAEVQGYLFSRPGPATGVPELIERLTRTLGQQALPPANAPSPVPATVLGIPPVPAPGRTSAPALENHV